MKKKIQKPFDVEAAKNGAKIETRDGHPVRIICYDRRGSSHPILALVNRRGTEELCFSYNFRGEPLYNGPGEDVLVIVEEVEVVKFKEGDWVVAKNDGGHPWLIFEVTPNYYNMEDLHENITARRHSIIDNSYHLWTIKDAKPGDVLVCEDDKRPFIFKKFLGCAPSAYCGIDTTDSIYIASDNPWTRDSVRPATYEEKQQFFNRLEEEGYKWDAESLTLTKISKKWRDNEGAKIDGYFVDSGSCIIVSHSGWNNSINHNVFATEKQAKSAIAMARISQIMANDDRFGGIVTDDEWDERPWYNILRVKKALIIIRPRTTYEFLSFHTLEQAELFLKENEDLIRDYYMMN